MAVGRDDYEERREARIDRLNGLSDKVSSVPSFITII